MKRIDLTKYPPGTLPATCVACGGGLVASPGDFPEPQCADLDACAEDVADQAIEVWGLDVEVDIAVEELGELVAAVMQYQRGRLTAEGLAAEIADVRHTLPILERLVMEDKGSSVLAAARQEKLRRTGARIRDARGARP